MGGEIKNKINCLIIVFLEGSFLLVEFDMNSKQFSNFFQLYILQNKTSKMSKFLSRLMGKLLPVMTLKP